MLLTVAHVGLRELARRRFAMVLVFLLPLVFYLVRIDVHWTAIRLLAIGIGWAVATLALFSQVAARNLDERLAVVGASPHKLFLGRQLALVAVSLLVAAAYFGLVAATQHELPRLGGIAVLLVTTVLISAPLGALVSFVIPRELEGALALLSVMAVQLLIDPDAAYAKVLPLWSTRELSAFAIETGADASLATGLTHFGITWLACMALALLAGVLRLRPVRLPQPSE